MGMGPDCLINLSIYLRKAAMASIYLSINLSIYLRKAAMASSPVMTITEQVGRYGIGNKICIIAILVLENKHCSE